MRSMFRIRSLVLALALAGRPSSIAGQADKPSLTSALGLGAICATGDLDDDEIPHRNRRSVRP